MHPNRNSEIESLVQTLQLAGVVRANNLEKIEKFEILDFRQKIVISSYFAIEFKQIVFKLGENDPFQFFAVQTLFSTIEMQQFLKETLWRRSIWNH